MRTLYDVLLNSNEDAIERLLPMPGPGRVELTQATVTSDLWMITAWGQSRVGLAQCDLRRNGTVILALPDADAPSGFLRREASTGTDALLIAAAFGAGLPANSGPAEAVDALVRLLAVWCDARGVRVPTAAEAANPLIGALL